nr:hypothetical protein [Sedimentibacter sp.]
MKNKYPIFVIIIILLFITVKFYFLNRNLELQINVTNTAYQELRTQKINNNYSEVRMTKLLLIEETFSWLHSVDVDKITLENYDGNTIDLKKTDVPLNNIILQGLALKYENVAADNTINYFAHIEEVGFHYTLRYYNNENIYEILIFDNGIIKYEGTFYESPNLLSMAKSLMPIINNEKNEVQMDAIDVMLNSDLATYVEYKVSDVDKLDYVQTLDALANNAVRLRASAYFIKENMIQDDSIDASKDIKQVLRSSGFSGGKQVDMYIYSAEDGSIIYVKLAYNNHEETYIFNSEKNRQSKSSLLFNIWTAG